MANWTETRTAAHKDLKAALRVVDNVLSFLKTGGGKPSNKERALFAAAIVFAYGIWENYVEQLATELTRKLSAKIEPHVVPVKIRAQLEKSTAWELSVSPGWRQIWKHKVEVKAIGDDGERIGLNTAKAGQVQNLLELTGVREAIDSLSDEIIPEHLDGSISDVSSALNRLVELRGEIVHTGAVPSELRKTHVQEWRGFVEDLADDLDRECRKQCKELL